MPLRLTEFYAIVMVLAECAKRQTHRSLKFVIFGDKPHTP